jgi:tetratricopeptide (TPR) repeat protein
MPSSLVFSLFNRPIPGEGVDPNYRSMRYDSMIWKELESLDGLQIDKLKTNIPAGTINPGIFALYRLDVNLINLGYPGIRLAADFLEVCMNRYQLTLQDQIAPVSFDEAAQLAIVLIEKRKISTSWSEVFYEFTSRYNKKETNPFFATWKTPLSIVVNLIDNKEEFLIDIISQENEDLGAELVVPLIMCLACSDQVRFDLVIKTLDKKSPLVQETIIKNLYQLGETEFASRLATKIIENYQSIDFESSSIVDYWNSKIDLLPNLRMYQSLAAMAQIAGKETFALKVLGKSNEILEAAITGVKIQKINLDGRNELIEGFKDGVQESMATDAISGELDFVSKPIKSMTNRTELKSTVQIIRQAKEMYKAGNGDLAISELRSAVSQTPLDFKNNFLRNKPKFIPNWKPIDEITALVEMNAPDVAETLVRDLVEQNPTNSDLTGIALKVYLETKNWKSALPLLEEKYFNSESSAQDLRQISDCYIALNQNEEAFTILETLIKETDVTIEDKNSYAKTALKIGKTESAKTVTDEILEIEPENSIALLINGKANALSGQTEKAISQLTRAIDHETTSAEPWIILSDIYNERADENHAIETLRQGLIALPDNKDLKTHLAKMLIKSGSISDALPYLVELRNESENVEIDLLLMNSMKKLHADGLDDLISELYQSHSENPAIAYEYAVNLIRAGKKDESLKILAPLVNHPCFNTEWGLAYADALIGFSSQFSKLPCKPNNVLLNKCLHLVESSLVADPTDRKALVLQAEILQQKGQNKKANDLFTRLMENQSGTDKTIFERILAGFSFTSALLDKFDIAFATIQEAISGNPDLVGLNQTAAEISALANDTEGAITQAERVLEIAPEVVDNLIWVADFFSRIGENQHAESILRKGITTYPDKSQMKVALIDFLFRQNRYDETKVLLNEIRDQLTTNDADEVLVTSSRIFKKLEDLDPVIDVLKLRIQSGDFTQGSWDLAGLYYQSADFENALKTIEEISAKVGDDDFSSCCTADVLIRLGRTEEAYSRLSNQRPKSNPSLLEISSFIPDNWIKFVGNSHATMQMITKCAFEKGSPEISLAQTLDWIIDDPTNLLARIYAHESGLGCNKNVEANQLTENSIINDDNGLNIHLASLKIESCLDHNDLNSAWEIYNSLDPEGTYHPVLKSIEARLIAFEGNCLEAENILDEIVAKPVESQDFELVIQTGFWRNLIKTAIKLSRWGEALTWATQQAKQAPWNISTKAIYFTTLVKSIEYGNVIDNLNIRKHCATQELSKISISEELNRIKGGPDDMPDYQRWLVRGKLAIAPDQTTIREFALVNPRPDDVAAMVAALRKTGQLPTAIQIGKKLEKSDEVKLQLALCQMDGNGETALKLIDEILKSAQINPIGLRLRSYLYQKNGNTEAAIQSLEEALKCWPNEAGWHVDAAEMWKTLGNDSNACAHLKEAFELIPEELETGIKLSQAYLSTKETGEAIKLLESLATIHPTHITIWETLAEAYFINGQMEKSMESAEKAGEIDPFSVKPYLLCARINLETGNIEKAQEQALLATEKVKNNAESLIFLGKVLERMGDKIGALEVLEKASKCEDANLQTLIDHANLVKNINGIGSAKDLIARFSNKYPENIELLIMMARAQEENGEIREAEITAKRVLRIKPDSYEMLMFVGKQQMQRGHLDQAALSFSQVVSLHPKQIEGYLLLSKVYETQREGVKALDILQKAIINHPFDSRSYIAAANLYREAKNYKTAEEMVRKAVDIDPNNVNIRRQLGALLALNLVHQSQEASSQL